MVSANSALSPTEEERSSSFRERQVMLPEHQRVCKLVDVLGEAGKWRDLAAMEDEVLAVAALLRTELPTEAAHMYSTLGQCNFHLGMYDRAIQMVEETRSVMAAAGHRQGQVAAGGNLGFILSAIGQYDRAAEVQEETLKLLEELGDREGQGVAHLNLGNAFLKQARAGAHDKFAKAIEQLERARSVMREVGNVASQGKACSNLGVCYQSMGRYEEAVGVLDQAMAIASAVGNRTGHASAMGNLATCYEKMGQFEKAIQLHKAAIEIDEEVGDTAHLARNHNNLAAALIRSDRLEEACTALFRSLMLWQKVERNVGSNDDRRVSLFEEIQSVFVTLQRVLLSQGHPCWALGVSSKAKARALSHRIAAGESTDRDAMHTGDLVELHSLQAKPEYNGKSGTLVAFDAGSGRWQVDLVGGGSAKVRASNLIKKASAEKTYGNAVHQAAGQVQQSVADRKPLATLNTLGCEDKRSVSATDLIDDSTDYMAICGSWWADVQALSRAEGRHVRIVEFSLIADFLAIWVLSGDGELLTSTTLPSVGLGQNKGSTIKQLLADTRKSMKVRGRDSGDAGDLQTGEPGDDTADQVDEAQPRANRCPSCRLRFAHCECKSAEHEATLLHELYQVLIAPVDIALARAEEILIIPHKELSEVPWAALLDADGHYLIQRHVIRVAPSLRVARQAAEAVQPGPNGHVVVLGNPLPLPHPFRSLPHAEEEAAQVEETLNKAGILVRDYFKGDRNPKATKDRVKQALQGSRWSHLACHGDLETDSIVLALPTGLHSGTETRGAKTVSAQYRCDACSRLCQTVGLDGPRWKCKECQDYDLCNRCHRVHEAALRADPDAQHGIHEAAHIFLKIVDEDTNLSMDEVQGGDNVAGVMLAKGSSVVLSACNTGRGEIKAEGVVGLARGFILAGASCVVVTLWSVDDRSTAALMEHTYGLLVHGVSVPCAIRKSMLHLARLPAVVWRGRPSGFEPEKGKTVKEGEGEGKGLGEEERECCTKAEPEQTLLLGPESSEYGSEHAGGGGGAESAAGGDEGVSSYSGANCDFLDGFRRVEVGAGERGSGVGVLPAVAAFMDVLSGDRVSGSRERPAEHGNAPSAADGISRIMEMGFGRAEVVKAMQAAHNNAERAVEYLTTGIPDGPASPTTPAGAGPVCEDAAERSAYWRKFCTRDVEPTCVIDFPYDDFGTKGLNFSRDSPDERLLERLYCFEDREDDMHLVAGGKRRRVVLKVHTLCKWRDRGSQLFKRALKITSAKVMYAYWNVQTHSFEQEQGVQSLKLLPVDRRLQRLWREAFRAGRFNEIEWEWRTPGSIPLGEDHTDPAVLERYDEVRAAIKMGESLFPRGADSTDKALHQHHSVWKETKNIYQTNKMLRDGREVEYEVFLRDDKSVGWSQSWARPVHWAGFLVMGATTFLHRDLAGCARSAGPDKVEESGSDIALGAVTKCSNECEDADGVEANATHVCQVCQQALCELCAAEHRRLKKTREHPLVPVSHR